MKIFTLSSQSLAGYFEPYQRPEANEWIERGGVRVLPSIRASLDTVFESILRTANQFVPSEAGSILLSRLDVDQPTLLFAACYGEHSRSLLGHEVPADCGVAGLVYRSSKPYLSVTAMQDPNFYSGIDATVGFNTQNLIAVPILINEEVCGVLELINRKTGDYEPQDLDLLNVFAGYISSSIQNALDAMYAHELAKRDELSGLYNDRYFHQVSYELVRGALETGDPLTMIFFDLDAFKSVNDQYGHLAGAAILSEIGGLLKDILPEAAVAARYGGDEYVVVWPGAAIDAGRLLAEKILDTIRDNIYLRHPTWLDAPILHLSGMLSASIGIAELRSLQLHTCLDPRTAKNQLLRAADTAMYEAKARGKGQIVIAASL